MKRKRRKDPLEGMEAEETAKKRVWAILQVLAGQMGVSEAARSGQISMTRYYHLEQKALQAMLYALSSQSSQGRGSPLEQLERAKQKLESMEQEHARQKQLLRMARKLWGPLADPETRKPAKPKEESTAPQPVVAMG